jgi:hypothetical protein
VPSPYEPSSPPEPSSGSADQIHEYVVKRVPDLGREDRIVLHVENGGDTGWRQIIPLTYDIPLDHPESRRTAEDD